MKRLLSCAVSFCLAVSLFGVPSIAFAKAAVTPDGSAPSVATDAGQQATDQGSASSSSASTSANATDATQGAAQGATQGADNQEADEEESALSPNNAPQSNVTEVTDGDITFFSVENPEAVAQANAIEAKGAQIAGSQVTVKLRSQIHPTSPSGNLTTDFGVKAEIIDNGTVIASADFVPTQRVSSGATGDEVDIVGDYTAKFPNRIPQGTYALKVSGQNYVSHVENNFVVLDGNRMNVKLVDMVTRSSNGESTSTTVDENNNIQGLLPYGDFNGDGRIDNNDTWMMTSALFQPASADAVKKFDLNADGAFDLLDAQYFATTIKEGNDVTSAVEELIAVVHGKPIITKDTSLTKVSCTDGVIKLGGISASDAPAGGGTDGSGQFAADAIRDALFDNPDASVILEQPDPITPDSPVSISVETTTASGLTDDENANPEDPEAIIEMNGLVIRPPAETTSAKTDGDVSALLDGSIIVEDENGEATEIEFKDGKQVGQGKSYSLVDSLVRASSQQAHAAGSPEAIVIDFGKRIAIKKITIKVTATTRPDAKLAEIGKVEFLNNMADRIAPPDLSVPGNLQGTPGDKKITFTWDAQQNVTGYEVRITTPEGKTTTSATVLATHTIAEKKLKSGTYSAAVRSINGDWKSPWSETVSVELTPTKAPDMPTSINVASGFRELTVTWPAVEDATDYVLFWQKEGEPSFKEVKNITASRYTITGLEDNTKYLLYLKAHNMHGYSPNSEMRSGTTQANVSVKVPWYKLINRTVQHQAAGKAGENFAVWNEEQAKLNDHIESISITDASDKNADAYAMIDGDYTTGYMPNRASSYYDGADVTFDAPYAMDRLIVTSHLSGSNSYDNGSIADYRVNIMDGDGNWHYYSFSNQVTLSRVGNAAPGSFWVKFPKHDVKRIVIGAMRPYFYKAPISEIAFYEYDSTESDINNLWADELHTVLKDDVDGKAVDEAYLDELEKRINAVDEMTVEEGKADSGECTPNRTVLLDSLKLAREALKFKNADEPVRVVSAIDNKTNANVGGVNNWQPLGVSAYEGDKLQIFVGGRANAGSAAIAQSGPTPLRLGISQYGCETKDVWTDIKPDNIKDPKQTGLNYGLSEITIPKLGNSVEGLENGGQLYVWAETSNKSMEFNVRVIGGMKIARLDLYKVTDDAEYRARCEKYVDALNEQVANLQSTHDERKHPEKYTDKTCVANTTDIMLDSIMFSGPATRFLDGLGRSASRDQQVEHLIETTKSSEDMMQLYWQHKGLGKMTTAEQQAYGGKNGIPAGHLNARFVRTNPGVFMYAAGNHIGVQYDSAAFTSPTGAKYDEAGLWQSGYYFGWGLAHEIGHQINQGVYTYAEVTNNYYAQLITANDNNANSRYDYPSLYDRVTSGTKGAPTGGVGIGIYWQLHLAYDNGYNYKKYGSYTDLYNNLIMARIDSIARNPEKAPGTGFTLDGADKDNALMRLACAAAGDAQTGFGRDILDYFVAWGGTPDETTIAYASQFEKDARPLQYVNDDARVYRIQGGKSVGADTEVWANLYEGDAESVGDDSMKIENSKIVNNRQVTLQMGISGNAANKTEGLIGFEVLRNGKPVAFKMFNPTKDGDQNTSGEITFTDTILTENNRTYTYEVRAVDNLLAYSKNTVKFPQIKVSDKGAYSDKSRWTASTNMVSDDDQGYNTDGDNAGTEGEAASSCEQQLVKKAVDAVKDNDKKSAYVGTVPTGDKVPTDAAGKPVAAGAPYIELDFGSALQVTGITVPTDDAGVVQGATFQMFDGAKWTNAVVGTGKSADDASTYYFDVAGDNQLKIYTASKMRIVGAADATGMTLHEIDVLGPVGDNADFLLDGNETQDGWVGYVDADTTYAPEATPGENTIPAGSLVFVGNYSGDTAYNALKLFRNTADGLQLVGGTQVLFAQEPGAGRNLGVTTDGRWIYYITPAELAEMNWSNPAGEVYAELYRVDDAMTLANERLVANTLTLQIPDKIPTIRLSIGGMTDGNFKPNVGN